MERKYAFVAWNCTVTVRRSWTSKYPVMTKYLSPLETRQGEPYPRALGTVHTKSWLSGCPMTSMTLAADPNKPLVALAFTPMIAGQATPATNLLFYAAPTVALALGASARWWPPLPILLALVGVTEATWGPLRGPAPAFLENSPAAQALTLWLQDHPPPSGRVACTLSGRGIAVQAGLTPVSLPSTWEHWAPEVGDGVLLTQVDFRGEDGGRGLALLEESAWRPVWVPSDAVLSWWEGQAPTPEDAWFVYFEAAP